MFHLNPPIVLALFTSIWASFSLFGCRALSYEEPNPAPFSSARLRVELDEVFPLAIHDPTSFQEKLNQMIPSWEDAKNLLKSRVHHDTRLESQFTEMRTVALRELPWALRAAREAGLSEVHVHRVGLQSGADNAPGDIALLTYLKSHQGLYTVTLHRPDDKRGLRLNGWIYQRDYGWRCLLKLGEHLETMSE